MHRACLILLALVVAVATTAVPMGKAAKAAVTLTVSMSATLTDAGQSAGPERSTPTKRCNGAGLLSCPFYKPAGVAFKKAQGSSFVPAATDGTALTGRPIPTTHRPPKSLSA